MLRHLLLGSIVAARDWRPMEAQPDLEARTLYHSARSSVIASQALDAHQEQQRRHVETRSLLPSATIASRLVLQPRYLAARTCKQCRGQLAPSLPVHCGWQLAVLPTLVPSAQALVPRYSADAVCSRQARPTVFEACPASAESAQGHNLVLKPSSPDHELCLLGSPMAVQP